jgi:hypothetical protein
LGDLFSRYYLSLLTSEVAVGRRTRLHKRGGAAIESTTTLDSLLVGGIMVDSKDAEVLTEVSSHLFDIPTDFSIARYR